MKETCMESEMARSLPYEFQVTSAKWKETSGNKQVESG
jgi:hypothetical protein